MPQKVNPDVLELIRGKTARSIGNLQTLLVLVKGLPLAYNRDLQEDKPALFDIVDTIIACLEIAAPLVAGATLKTQSINARIEEGYLDATSLMEYLIQLGIPQRSAHHMVGSLVGEAAKRGVQLAELPIEEFAKLDPKLDDNVLGVLGVKNAVGAFKSYGSTAPEQVKAQIEQWKSRLELS